MKTLCSTLVLAALTFMAAASAQAQEGPSDAELAKQLANPISSLISVPLEFSFNQNIGPADGDQVSAVFQPVIPFTINDDLSIVVRTIVPLIWQEDVAGNSGDQSGLGDSLQSFFFVPKSRETALGTFTYGPGPAILWPTSTDRLLGPGTLGIGPTGVFLFQNGGWTYGALANHIWGVADTRGGVGDLSATFIQPFLAYTTEESWTYILNSESTYDWTAHEWVVPVTASISKLTTIGGQKVQFQVGARYWVEDTPSSPEGLGASFKVTFLF